MAQVEKIDFELLLKPIAGDYPAGIDIQTEGYYAIETLIRQDQWDKVQGKCLNLLANTTKDLRIAVYLAESLAKLGGLEGLKEGFRVLMGLIDRYWSQLYPRSEIDDHPQASIWLEKLDKFVEHILRVETPLTAFFEGRSYGLGEWQNCERVLREIQAELRKADRPKEKTFAQRELPNAESAQAQLSRTIGGSQWEFYEGMLSNLKACSQSVEEFARLMRYKFDSDSSIDTREYPPPSFSLFRRALEECTAVIAGTLEEKRPTVKAIGISAVEADPVSSSEQKVVPGPMRSRDEAIQQLKKIAAFFQATEPHSPVAYLVLRAARWGDLSLDDWLDEVVKEPSVLGKIRETLGIQAKPKT